MLPVRPFVLAATSAALTMVLVGCGSGSKQSTTGFLSTYDNVSPDGDRLVYMNNRELATYDRFIIDPIQVKLYDGASAEKARREGKLARREIDQITTYGRAAMTRALTDAGYAVASQPGEDTLRFRIALTDLKEATPALNILPQSKLTGLGAGKISIEAEAVDSRSGEQIGALVATRSGEFLWIAEGASKSGDAQRALDEWAADLVRRLRKARGEM